MNLSQIDHSYVISMVTTCHMHITLNATIQIWDVLYTSKKRKGTDYIWILWTIITLGHKHAVEWNGSLILDTLHQVTLEPTNLIWIPIRLATDSDDYANLRLCCKLVIREYWYYCSYRKGFVASNLILYGSSWYSSK